MVEEWPNPARLRNETRNQRQKSLLLRYRMAELREQSSSLVSRGKELCKLAQHAAQPAKKRPTREGRPRRAS